MNAHDQGWARINRPVFRISIADKIHAAFLRCLIFCYRFEHATAINPRLKHSLSSTIDELEGALLRIQIGVR
jgi:hypothetical protein